MINFADKIKRLEREYLIQTTTNDQEKTISSSIFYNGHLVNTHTNPFPDRYDNQTLIDHVQRVHKRVYLSYDSLLSLVELKGDTGYPDLFVKLGEGLYGKKLYQEGEDLLTKLTKKYPDSSGMKAVLGKIYLATGKLEEACNEFKDAVQLSPDFPDCRNLLGITYLKSRQAMSAIQQFKKAVELNIYFSKAHFNLGLAYILNGIIKEDFEHSRDIQKNCDEAFGKAITFNPGLATNEYEKAMNLVKSEKFEEAYEILLPIAEKETLSVAGESQTEMYLRFVHDTDGMSEEGIARYLEKLKTLLKTNPGYADIHNEIGMAYVILSKFMSDKAIVHFTKAIEINPEFSKAIKNLRLSQNELKGFKVLLEAIIK